MSDTDSYIFQATPREWDLTATLEELSSFLWRVTSYRADIAPDDVVYLWEALPTAAVLAVATVVSKPRKQPMDPKMAKFMHDPSKYVRDTWYVRIEVSRVLERPITREELLRHPLLSKQSPISAPYQGTNFFVPPDRAAALGELVATR
jgi:5-methylcytosine-specific restriction enzyme B